MLRGRVVGEDAINRLLSPLRRMAEGIGAGSFRVETIIKIGYRLLALALALSTASADADAVAPTGISSWRPGRRTLIAGGASLFLATAAATWI